MPWTEENGRFPWGHKESDILECKIKWVLENITTNKASGGDGIPVELFQIQKDDAVKVLYSVCQQIWTIQQWPQDWKSCEKKRCPFHYRGLECKSRKSRNTWSNRQIWPWNME